MYYLRLQRPMKTLQVFTMFMFSLLIMNNTQAQDIIFAAPPTQSPEQTLTNYKPLVDYLSEVTGRKIVVQPAKNYFEYTRKMRAGDYDIVFDGPHFINYRIHKMNYVVLAKMPGELHFVVVVKKDSGINSLRDLDLKRVCAPSAPNLATLTFLSLYSNPLRDPEILPVQSLKQGVQCVRDGQAPAAVMRDKFWEKLKNKSGLKVIYTTRRKIPAPGLTIKKQFDPALRKRIVQALISKGAREHVQKAFSTIGGGTLIAADQREYEGLDKLLNIVWGFHHI
jgi:ABC-type phosphate/phosphonate transport system substrate-binding protein